MTRKERCESSVESCALKSNALIRDAGSIPCSTEDITTNLSRKSGQVSSVYGPGSLPFHDGRRAMRTSLPAQQYSEILYRHDSDSREQMTWFDSSTVGIGGTLGVCVSLSVQFVHVRSLGRNLSPLEVER